MISAYVGLIVFVLLDKKRDYLESLYDDAMKDYELWRESMDWDSATVADWDAFEKSLEDTQPVKIPYAWELEKWAEESE